jgi:predicted kinase
MDTQSNPRGSLPPLPEAVLFIGLQASGKSTFYQRIFANTHLRINLDMLRTRHRETALTETCLAIRQSFVVDNTNPARQDRARYIVPAKQAGFRVVGYYFQSRVADALNRNVLRPPAQRVPEKGILGTVGRLERPSAEEGFDALFYVRIAEDSEFIVEEWNNAVL